MIKIGDLVKHVHLGGIAIVTNDHPPTDRLRLKWLIPHTNYDEKGKSLYFPRFLERL